MSDIEAHWRVKLFYTWTCDTMRVTENRYHDGRKYEFCVKDWSTAKLTKRCRPLLSNSKTLKNNPSFLFINHTLIRKGLCVYKSHPHMEFRISIIPKSETGKKWNFANFMTRGGGINACRLRQNVYDCELWPIFL